MVETYADYLIAQGERKGKLDGQAEHARKTVLRLGRKVFGEPSASDEAQLSAIADADRLDRMTDRLADHSSKFKTWSEFLAAT